MWSTKGGVIVVWAAYKKGKKQRGIGLEKKFVHTLGSGRRKGTQGKNPKREKLGEGKEEDNQEFRQETGKDGNRWIV